MDLGKFCCLDNLYFSNKMPLVDTGIFVKSELHIFLSRCLKEYIKIFKSFRQLIKSIQLLNFRLKRAKTYPNFVYVTCAPRVREYIGAMSQDENNFQWLLHSNQSYSLKI